MIFSTVICGAFADGLDVVTNPFVRSMSESLQRSLGMTGADPVAVFAETRRRKDNF